MMSANGKVSSKKGTKLKLKKIGSQEFVVLDNTPNVLSVGVLLEQGYTFYWTPGSTKVSTSNGTCSLAPLILPSSSTGLCKSNYQEHGSNLLPSKCVLITPAGKHILLRVSSRVPVLHDGIVDVPGNKTSAARGISTRDSKPEGSRLPLAKAAACTGSESVMPA